MSPDGSSAQATLTVTGPEWPGAAPVLAKLKLRDPDRFLVKPGLDLVRAGEVKTFTITVAPGEMAGFRADAEKAAGAAGGAMSRGSTAVVVAQWVLASEAHRQEVEGLDGSGLALNARNMWAAQEKADKSVFVQSKFGVRIVS